MTAEKINEQYEKLCELQREMQNLASISGLLNWDQQVQMPSGAAEMRGRQSAYIEGLWHQKQISPHYGELLNELDAQKENLSLVQRANIRESLKVYHRSTKVPQRLVEEMVQAGISGHEIWVQARKENNFSLFLPVLNQHLKLQREYASCFTSKKEEYYNVFLDLYEPGMRQETLVKVFSELKPQLKKILNLCQTKTNKNLKELSGSFSSHLQHELGKKVLTDIGFDFSRGRFDKSVHPFCGGPSLDDVRITSRYNESDIYSVFSTIHECGHALYEQGLDKKLWGLPVGQARSTGIHESQSLLWEKQVAQSLAFTHYFYPLVVQKFPHISNLSLENFYSVVNEVKPSLIRVDADEVTYPFHVILRFEIETELFNDAIQVKNLPEVFNSKMKDYLGIVPPNDAQGVLQDVHWSSGAFGYFPCYTLGAIYAAQIFDTYQKANPKIDSEIKNGNFKNLKLWLTENIFEQGSVYSTDELLKKVTGRTIDISCFVNYLSKKYEAIYV